MSKKTVETGLAQRMEAYLQRIGVEVSGRLSRVLYEHQRAMAELRKAKQRGQFSREQFRREFRRELNITIGELQGLRLRHNRLIQRVIHHFTRRYG